MAPGPRPYGPGVRQTPIPASCAARSWLTTATQDELVVSDGSMISPIPPRLPSIK